MLRLNMSAEPRWLDLAPGVRVRVAPCTSSLMARARGAEVIEALVAGGASPADLSIALAKEIALMAILDWEGIGDAEGAAVAPGPETIRALMDVYPIFEAFQLGYVAKGLMLDSEKRLCALADWHFGGGGAYCQACPSRCQTCPARLNRPETIEGLQVWDLALRMTGQLRAIPGAALGWDMTAGLALAAALGVDTFVVAELLPEIEAIAIRKINEQAGANRHE